MFARWICLSIVLSSCSSILGGENAGSEVTSAPSAESPGQVKVSPTDALELRVAQLWSRVDDLEAQLLRQKERSKLLEKGLLLGIVPDELKAEDERPKAVAKSGTSAEKNSQLDIPVPLPAPKAAANHDRELYRKLLQEAQDKFNRANYGQAIVAFNDIGSKFDDSITEGSHHYWIGLSWFYLKEYKLSEESFGALKARYPSNPWSQYAGFYLAKIEQSRGLNQRALDQFQKILDDNPERDLGEMARAEIERMKEKL